MKLTVLVDNNTLTDRYFLGEPGVSYLIEDGGKRILFDVGYSDVFIENARRMNLSLLDLDCVVLSHGHLDHTWGLAPLIRLYEEAAIEGLDHDRPTLVAHPLVFSPRTINGLGAAGAMVPEEIVSGHFKVELSEGPIWLTERIVFLGEIGRNNSFEARAPVGTISGPASGEDDYLLDDSALAYKSRDGLVIITGCSHAGICNIIEQAKRICGENNVVDIIGGLHLIDPPDEQLRGTLEYMERLAPGQLHACHCTDLDSKLALSGVVNLREVGVGLRLDYD